jgi:hypothetical protein
MIALYLGIALLIGFGGGAYVGWKYGSKALSEMKSKYEEAEAIANDWKKKIEDL